MQDSYISEENGLRCKLCNNDKLYCGKANTRRHIREVHLKGYLNLQHKRRASCNICDKTFANNTVLNTHMRNIHIQPEPTLPCPKCWKKFKMVKALRRHLQDVHQVSADIKQLKTNLGVDSHSSAGTSLTTSPEYNDDEFDPIFTCDDCKLSFVTTEALNRHNKVIHPKKLKLPTIIPAERKLSVKLLGPSEESTEPEIKCPECDKRFPNKSALSGHSVVHKKANLEPHIKTMLKAVFGAVCNSTLICSLCGIEVVNSLEGRLHVYIKHPEKYNELVTTMAQSSQGYLQCAHCPDKLPCPEAMLNHIESQHPTKYIPTCNVCGHKELKERDLNHHFKQEHPNVSRYTCSVCERSFNQKRDLEHHVSRSHSVNAVQCPYCPEKLVKVKLHVTIKHPEKAEEFTEMRKAAIREEQVERMRFNQFLVRGEVTDNPDGRVRNSKTIRMRSKAGKRKARKCSESEKESSTEDDNFDPVDRKPNVCFLKETEKFIVPETYTLEKHTTNHLIEVHRVPPPIPPKAPESILIEREFGLPENVVDNEVDVKPDVSQLAELRSNLDTNCSRTGTVRKPSRRKSGRR